MAHIRKIKLPHLKHSSQINPPCLALCPPAFCQLISLLLGLAICSRARQLPSLDAIVAEEGNLGYPFHFYIWHLHNCQPEEGRSHWRNEAQFTELVACKLSHLPGHPASQANPWQLRVPIPRILTNTHFHFPLSVFSFLLFLAATTFSSYMHKFISYDGYFSQSLDHVRVSLRPEFPPPLRRCFEIYIFMKFPFLFSIFVHFYKFTHLSEFFIGCHH